MNQTFHATIAYDGTEYAGWQVQPNQRTIQHELERALGSIFPNARLNRVLGSGRTDAGVHAMGQVARIVLPSWPAEPERLTRAINAKLPGDIVVRQTRRVTDSFHPIGDAVSKTYRYFVQIDGDRHPMVSRFSTRVRQRLEMDRLEQAASVFMGEHDFAAMQATGAPRKDTSRSVTLSRWLPVAQPLWGYPSDEIDAEIARCPLGSRYLMYEVTANGFLYNMVRNMVGSMLEVGRGRFDVQWLTNVLHGGDRTRSGPTAAAQGLFLHQVRYPDEIFDD